jgi:16S rRNA (cytosine967-C5)-methyltransferase
MTDNDKAPPLWRQLQATVQVLMAVHEGKSGSAAMELVPASLRGGVQALSFHAWRNMGRAQALRSQLAKRPPPPAADTLLCLALALTWDPEQALYDEFTLVNQTVEAAKNTSATKAQASFINACLRRFIREREALISATRQSPVAEWNHPAWWIKRVQREHPGQWQHILESANRHPPMTLRINVRKASVAGYLHALHEAGIAVSTSAGTLVELTDPVPVSALPGFAEGMVSVQDGAAQVAARLLLEGASSSARPRILDACAAPGGKTAHLLELCDAEVFALEVDATRAQRIHQTLDRLGLNAHVVCADAAATRTWWDGTPFDHILLDAPCTASGIVRRHPDIRWLRRESDIAQLANEQRNLLAALWPLLKTGGRLLYCTCSIFRAEGDEQVKAFLANNKDAKLLPSPGHLLPQNSGPAPDLVDNQAGNHDGFFYALFEKTSF